MEKFKKLSLYGSDSDDELDPLWGIYQTELARTPLLHKSEQWPEWDNQMRYVLSIIGEDDLLCDNGDKEPENDPKALANWRHRQFSLCRTVETRLGPTVKLAVGKHKTVNALLSAVDEFLKPTGAEAFLWHSKLAERLRFLSLSNFQSLLGYICEIHDIRKLYERIEVEFPESIYVFAFLDGLPSSEAWVQSFRRDVYRETGITSADVQEDKPLLTLEEAFRRARIYESADEFQTSKPSKKKPAVQEATKEEKPILKYLHVGRETAAVEIPWCSFCKIPWHSRSECDRFQAKRQAARRARNRRRQNKKKQKNESEED